MSGKIYLSWSFALGPTIALVKFSQISGFVTSMVKPLVKLISRKSRNVARDILLKEIIAPNTQSRVIMTQIRSFAVKSSKKSGPIAAR